MATRKEQQPADFNFLIGELSGSMRAVLAQLAHVNEELVRMNAEQDHKHEENIKLITLRHEENLERYEQHEAKDTAYFNRIFKWQHYVVAAAAVISVLWTVATVLWPLLGKIRLEQ